MSVFDYEAMLSSSLEYSLTALWVVITTILFLKFQKRRARRAELDRWIHRSRHETRTKVQRCLELSSTNAAEEEEEEESSSRLSAKEVRDRILSRKLDPAQHVVALAKRCRKYGRDESRSNAITEELYDDAYDIAKNLQPSNKDNSPLYGVPISVKDSIGIRGCLSMGGLACRLKERAQRDSLIVQVLKSAGAIPLCRGNVPQIMMLPESHNRIWGRSRNPYDLSRTPGGSSGGDAALVAMRCVPLAVCSDVAGSIRIPAAFCGIVGFKPTSTRLSYNGVMKPRKDNKSGTSVAIPATVGPIARSVEDCALFMKAVCVSELFDGDLNVPRIPFDDKEYQSKTKLKIGYFETDAWFEPCAAAKRGLHETIAALEKAGHTCVPYDSPTDGWASYGLLVAINAAEGNMRNFVEALEGEELIPEYGTLWKASNLPNWLRPIVLQLIDKRRGHLLKSGRSGGISVYELWKLTAELLEMRVKWSNEVIRSGVDAIVSPALPLPALPHGSSKDLTSSFSYMFVANMLLWPAGIVPVTTVRHDEQSYPIDDLPANQRDHLATLADKVMQNSAGCPLGVSIMTPAFQDEKCLRVMKEVERLVEFKEEPTAYKTGEPEHKYY